MELGLLQNTVSRIRLRHGLLVFESQQHLDDILEGIKQLEKHFENEIQDQNNRGDLASTPSEGDHEDTEEDFNALYYAFEDYFDGLNPLSGIALPDLESHEGALFAEDPALYCFEEALGFKSVRRILEAETLRLERSEDYRPEVAEPDDFFIEDDDLRAVLNPALEIQIGESIYKFVSSSGLLEIKNGDYEILEELREQFKPPIVWDHEPVHPNIEEIQGHKVVSLRPGIILVHQAGPVQVQKCFADFTYSRNQSSNQKFAFTNQSAGNYDALVWKFGDGTQGTFKNGTHTYQNYGTYQVTLELYKNGHLCSKMTKSLKVTTTCAADFDYFVEETKVMFTDTSSIEANDQIWDYYWEFGDGNFAQGVSSPTHTYQTTGTYNVCLTITTQIGCESKICKTVEVDTSCCRTNKSVKTGSKGNRIIDIGNDRGLKGKVWIRSNPFAKRVGAKTKAYRKKKGKWRKTKAEYIKCSAGGKVYIPGAQHKCETPLTVNVFDDGRNKKRIRDTNSYNAKISAKRNSVSSFHEVVDNGASGGVSLLLLTKAQCD